MENAVPLHSKGLDSTEIVRLVWDALISTKFCNRIVAKYQETMLTRIVELYEKAGVHFAFSDISVLMSPALALKAGLLKVEFRTAHTTKDGNTIRHVVVSEFPSEHAIFRVGNKFSVHAPEIDAGFVCTEMTIGEDGVTSTVVNVPPTNYNGGLNLRKTEEYVYWRRDVVAFVNKMYDAIAACNKEAEKIADDWDYAESVFKEGGEPCACYITNYAFLLKGLTVRDYGVNLVLCDEHGNAFL